MQLANQEAKPLPTWQESRGPSDARDTIVVDEMERICCNSFQICGMLIE